MIKIYLKGKSIITKNGFRGFSQVTNMLIITIVTMFMFNSCATYKGQKMKADFVGFSDNVSTSYRYTNKCIVKKWRKQSPPYDLITSNGNPNTSGKNQMSAAVYGLKQGSQTAAYYALDNALDRVEFVQKKFMENDPESKYYVIMLTDGLDNKVTNKDAYNKKLQQKMNTLMKKYSFFNLFKSKKTNNSNAFQSYVLLYKGKDLKESGYTNDELTKILTPFTGSQNAPRPEPIISEDINELVDILEAKLVSRSFNFFVPAGYVGKKVRMVLNSRNSSEPIYFEGDFSLEGGFYYFKNIITSNGLTVQLPPSKYLSSSYSRNGLVEFGIEDLKLYEKPYKVNKNDVNQWFEEFGKFRYNSEYSTVTASKKNAYLIVILDGSLSFREKFGDAQDAIMRIVNIISNL